jgi:pyruvate kinase
MRRAKIVCTLGPSVANQESLEKLMLYGMDVARLNFSHGTHAQHAQTVEWIRAASIKVRKAVAILGDLQGPKIRTGNLKNGGPVPIKEGNELIIVTDESLIGDEKKVSTTYEHLAMDVKVGDRILLDDGLLELKVLETDGRTTVRTEVVVGGMLGQHKGINLPGVALRADALTPKDEEDLQFALKNGVDYVALSFVRRPEDIQQCRTAMEKYGRRVPIIAKLEKPEALAHLDAIVAMADGCMVARGDLGVEIPPENVPAIQKQIVRKCNARGIPVIVATQMLDSMIKNPRPTRAEASDVANAIFDGADAVMLSGESASGKYPFESVQMMNKIVMSAEGAVDFRSTFAPVQIVHDGPAPFNDVVCSIAVKAATEAQAAVICCFTLGGTTARLLSHYRPGMPVVAFSPNQEVRRRLGLYWGVIPRILEPLDDVEPMVKRVEEELLARELAKRGDRVVIVFGTPIGIAGKTNSLRIHQIPN